MRRGLPRGAADRRGRTRPRARWAAVAGIGVAAAAALAFALSDGGDEPAVRRALTSDEANRLAVARFRNYEAEGRAVTITVPGTAGESVVTGSVDYHAKTGYGVVRGSGRDASGDGLIEWTATTVRFHPLANAPATAPASPPATGWYDRPLRTAGNTLDGSLAIALGLGNDRPDNPQLLPQNGAEWVGSGQVRGRPTDVMTGPDARGKAGTADTVRYWIGADGTMYRVQADVASEPRPVVIEFDTQKYVPVRRAPKATPTPGPTPKR
ncbi:hypothetical protein SLA_3906 [Streptomyces laurentii]|uniref:Uncharacterized protein n=1 Tax=Streptomyces laurentii TaxID=39478 RepID=A0A160P0F1_STRLU|nr:hypothetical protein SLA_3906 [Streptomyces laurentii]